MQQSRVMSATEALANVLIGYVVALAATAIVLPAFGYAVSAADAVGISVAFTAISLVRTTPRSGGDPAQLWGCVPPQSGQGRHSSW